MLNNFCIHQIQFEAVVLEDPDVAKALIEYVTQCGIETLLLGGVSKSGLSRYRSGLSDFQSDKRN